TMAALTFESKLRRDGSLAVPEEVVERLNLHPGDEVRVQIEAANGLPTAIPTALQQAVSAMIHRTPEDVESARERAMRKYKPERSVPSGKTLADVISGQWPGDESDEQIKTILDEIS